MTGKRILERSISSGERNTRGAAVDLENEAVREEYIDRTLSAIRGNGYTTPNDLERNLKNDIDISYRTLGKSGINWDVLIKAYKKKYGEPIIKLRENEGINWG